jgi:hypothetical protein
MATVSYDELDPGIRDLVRRLNDAGIETCDSGDGETKVATMACALPFAHVFAAAKAKGVAGLIEAHDTAARMATLVPQTEPTWTVQVNYDLAEDVAVVMACAPCNDRSVEDDLRRALRNCLTLATKKIKRAASKGDWPDIVRFCADAGVVPSPLRKSKKAS